MPDVVVIGGGPSGLAAAYRLQQAGTQVRILDAADQIGGKLRTTERGGFLVDQGAFFVPTTHRALLSLAGEIGMAEEIVPGGFVLGVARDGVIHTIDGDHAVRDVLRTRLLSPLAKLKAARLLPEMLRSRRATYERMPECGRYDTETLGEWAKAHLPPDLVDYLIDTVVRGIFATSAETSPRVDFLAILSLLTGAKLVAFRRGMGSYADWISRDLKYDLGSEVTAVEELERGARITWRDLGGVSHTEDVDGCITAVPAAVTRRLITTLDPWRDRFLQRIRHGKLIVLNVGLSRPPDAAGATYVLVPGLSHSFVTGIMLDHEKAPDRAPAGKGLLSVAVLDSWSEQHWDTDDTLLADLVLDGVEQILPGTRATVEFTEVHRWRQEFATVGYYRDLGWFRQLCDGDRRVQLAGDFRSMSNLDAATRSGEQAARALLAALA